MKENSRLGTAETRIDEFISMGRTALNELHEQRNIMKVMSIAFLEMY